jgi:hypothetical protein
LEKVTHAAAAMTTTAATAVARLTIRPRLMMAPLTDKVAVEIRVL